jgi:hypothetical protein
MDGLPPKFKEVYEEYYLLHPDAAALPPTKLYYLHRQWIFPNHIDIMLDLVGQFRQKFYPEANIDVALFAALLHDAGLVYERTERSPAGHENRSVEYATILLRKHGFSDDFIHRVSAAIESTEPDVEPASDEAIIVRNADAYSHLSSLHFVAKAHFADDLLWYIEWFDKKVHGSLKKLTISELIEEKKPLVAEYERLLAMYRSHKEVRFIDR